MGDLAWRMVVVLALFGCNARGATVEVGPAADVVPAGVGSAKVAEPVAVASASAVVTAAKPQLPAAVEQLDVPGDLTASLVRSANGKPPRIVFLPGVCSNAGAYLWSFAETARASGGVVAIEGDRPCGVDRNFRSITSDPDHEEPRIEAALRAAGVESPASADIVLVGYSLGATLIENLVKRSPQRYPRVVIIGSPRDPRLDRLGGAHAVATVSCSLDVPARMRSAARRLSSVGIRSHYFEMAGCTHGNLAEGNAVFADVFRWLELESG